MLIQPSLFPDLPAVPFDPVAEAAAETAAKRLAAKEKRAEAQRRRRRREAAEQALLRANGVLIEG